MTPSTGPKAKPSPIVESLPYERFHCITSVGQAVLGAEMADVASGICGIVDALCENLRGQVQVGLQPFGGGQVAPDAVYKDCQGLCLVGPGMSASMPPIDTSVTLKLGEVAKDLVSGFQGIAVEKVTYKNGCVYFMVQPPIDKKRPDQMPTSVMFLHSRLVRVGAGLTEVVEKVKKIQAPTGGPSRSMSSFRRA